LRRKGGFRLIQRHEGVQIPGIDPIDDRFQDLLRRFSGHDILALIPRGHVGQLPTGAVKTIRIGFYVDWSRWTDDSRPTRRIRESTATIAPFRPVSKGNHAPAPSRCGASAVLS